MRFLLVAWAALLPTLAPAQAPYPTIQDSLRTLEAMRVKTIRVTLHVFQDDEGERNIPNEESGRHWLRLLIRHVNKKLARLDTMNLDTPSPYFADSKIRFELMELHFWRNTELWAMGNKNNPAQQRAQYAFVLEQPEVTYKASSIHVFLPGNFPDRDLTTGGVAAGIGDPRYAMVENIFHWYTARNNFWVPANALRHEFGHNFGLRHEWGNDGLEDTPPNCGNCCWSGPDCSNNMMGYNSTQAAMTLQQALVLHRHIDRHPELWEAAGAE